VAVNYLQSGIKKGLIRAQQFLFAALSIVSIATEETTQPPLGLVPQAVNILVFDWLEQNLPLAFRLVVKSRKQHVSDKIN